MNVKKNKKAHQLLASPFLNNFYKSIKTKTSHTSYLHDDGRDCFLCFSY